MGRSSASLKYAEMRHVQRNDTEWGGNTRRRHTCTETSLPRSLLRTDEIEWISRPAARPI
eukprot:3936162-Rhodomonas_salina.2